MSVTCICRLASVGLVVLLPLVQCWVPPSFSPQLCRPHNRHLGATAAPSNAGISTTQKNNNNNNNDSNNPIDEEELFDDFVDFLLSTQSDIVQSIHELESTYGSKTVFTKDSWGMFQDNNNDKERSATNAAVTAAPVPPVGGITRVLQGGTVIEKGACSFTLIGSGILSKERAATIRARQPNQGDGQSAVAIQEGDEYAAAALSVVLHSKSPHVPTFRSDVRVFLVKPKHRNGSTMAWFGGGADLTPYYLNSDDIAAFHMHYYTLCDNHWGVDGEYSYNSMKKACDDYFYLPARQEHRGTGGIFFDDMDMTTASLDFVKDVTRAWMPSWFPIVEKRQDTPVTSEQRHWQLLRRGRYLEFNLLYDRGVRFGLANANPRVEGVMVSAPPLIAFDYNHPIAPNSPEAQLMQVLKTPKVWI